MCLSLRGLQNGLPERRVLFSARGHVCQITEQVQATWTGSWLCLPSWASQVPGVYTVRESRAGALDAGGGRGRPDISWGGCSVPLVRAEDGLWS